MLLRSKHFNLVAIVRAVFCLSCLCSVVVFAAAAGSNQVSLKATNMPLRHALDKISEQARLNIVYPPELVDGFEVTCDIASTPIKSALAEVLKNTDIIFDVQDDGRIVLAQGAPAADVRLTLRGRVVDKESGEPLADVNVFLANTRMGAASNREGHFAIEGVPLGTFDLVASRIGYEVGKRKLVARRTLPEDLEMRLAPRPFQAPEIEVSATAMEQWREDFEHFRALFFGTTKNAATCKINNAGVLDFERSKSGAFSAIASEALIIENSALGYKLDYVLETFRATESLITMRGFSKYTEQSHRNRRQSVLWELNRQKTYQGSLKHFLATLCRMKNALQFAWKKKEVRDNYLEDEGFKVYLVKEPWTSQDRKRLRDAARILQPGTSDDHQVLRFPHYLMVHYTREVPPPAYVVFKGKIGDPKKQISLVTMTADSLLVDMAGNIFDSNGLRVDGFGLRTYGYWSWERMADRLPWDYGSLGLVSNKRE